MKTDRKLLELAAKAAGYKVGKDSSKYTQTDFDMCWSIANGCMVFHHGDVGSEYPALPAWNPLTDDGDALRLAVKLNIDAGNPGMRLSIDWRKGDDPYAATRRTIVSCAAQLGENK